MYACYFTDTYPPVLFHPVLLSHQALEVDTTLLGQFPFQVGSLFQFIGEMRTEQETKKLCMAARVGRNVDGLDLGMYEQALKIRRDFLQS